MSPHHSDQMSQRSQVSRVSIWRCFLTVFVFVFVIVFVFLFVFVIVLLLVRPCPLITLIKCLKGHKSLGSLSEDVLWMFLSLTLSLYLSLYLSLSCLIVGQVMSSHHSDKMSQRSQVSRVTLWRCSPNVFFIVIIFVIVFVIVFLLVRSYPLITLIKCLKGHKSLGSLFEGVL